MVTRVPFKWGNANFAWETNPFPNQSVPIFTWDDVALLIEILEAVGGGAKPEDFFKDKKEKRKKFITLMMKCGAFDKEYKETKEVINRQIRIEDVSLVAKEVLGINIKVDL